MASFLDLLTDDADLPDAYRFAQLTGPQQNALQQRLYERGAVRGVEDLGRGMLGMQPSATTQREQAGLELKALAQKVRPGTVEFYDAAIPILQKYNLPVEAAAMEAQRLALETGKAELDPLMKMKRTRDLLAKAPDAASPAGQAAIAALDRKIAAYGTQQAGGADPELVKLLDAKEKAAAAGQTERAAVIQKAIDALLAKNVGEKPMTEGEKARLKLAQAKEDRDATQDKAKADEAEASAKQALSAAIGNVDLEIRDAKRLLAHPGVDRIVGPRYGVVPLGGLGVFGADAANAGVLYETLEGQLFIRALQDLKATSKTGASGLGQLTEVEGGKIQRAKAALNRRQETAQFLRTLQAYITALESGRTVAADILAKKGGTAPAAPAPIVDVPPRVDPRTVKPAPAAAPAKRTFKSTQVK